MPVEVYDPEPLPLAVVPPPGRQVDSPCGTYIQSSRDRSIYYLDFYIPEPAPSSLVAIYSREFLLGKHKLLLDEWCRRHLYACRRFQLPNFGTPEKTCGKGCALVEWPGVHAQPLAQRLWERQASTHYEDYCSLLTLLQSLESSGTPITAIARHTALNPTDVPAAMFDFPDVPGPVNLPEIHDEYTDIGQSLKTSILDPDNEDVIKTRECRTLAVMIQPRQPGYGTTAATSAYEPVSGSSVIRRAPKTLVVDSVQAGVYARPSSLHAEAYPAANTRQHLIPANVDAYFAEGSTARG